MMIANKYSQNRTLLQTLTKVQKNQLLGAAELQADKTKSPGLQWQRLTPTRPLSPRSYHLQGVVEKNADSLQQKSKVRSETKAMHE